MQENVLIAWRRWRSKRLNTRYEEEIILQYIRKRESVKNIKKTPWSFITDPDPQIKALFFPLSRQND